MNLRFGGDTASWLHLQRHDIGVVWAGKFEGHTWWLIVMLICLVQSDAVSVYRFSRQKDLTHTFLGFMFTFAIEIFRRKDPGVLIIR